MILLQYPACSTCQKAKKWLSEQGIATTYRHIVEDKPSEAELRVWIKLSGLEVKRFFNTSGVLYKEMGLKDKLANLSQDEQIALLASDGKLIKRPLLIGESFVLVGFKPTEWSERLK